MSRLSGFDCRDCQKRWFLGRAGECVLANLSCSCPDGFSGVDTMTVTQTCHVNESLAEFLHWSAFFISVVAFFFTTLCLLRFHQKCSKRNSTRGVKVIQRMTMLALLFGLAYMISAIVLLGILAIPRKSISFKDFKGLLPFLLGLVCIFQSLTYTTLYVAWYYSLPDPQVYGRILNYPHFIVLRPNFVPRLNIATASLWTLASLICFVVLPKRDSDKNYGETPAKVFLVFLPLSTIMSLSSLALTLSALSRLYKGACKAAKPVEGMGNKRTRIVMNGLEEQLMQIESAVKGLTMLKPMAVGVMAPLLFLALMGVATGGLYQYLLLSWSVIGLSVGTLTIAVITLRRTNGGYLLRRSYFAVR